MSLNRTFQKGIILLHKIGRHSSILTFLVASIITIFFTVGGMYDIIEKPVPLIPQQGGGWSFIYPGSITYQTISESIVAAISYVLAILGLFAIYRSSRHAYRPRQAYLLFIVGSVLIIIAIVYITLILQMKIGV